MLGSQITDIVNTSAFQWVHDDDMLALRFERQQKPREQTGAPSGARTGSQHKDGTWRASRTSP